MNLYELLKEENQRFWDFLDLNNPTVNASVMAMEEDEQVDLIEEIELL